MIRDYEKQRGIVSCRRRHPGESRLKLLAGHALHPEMLRGHMLTPEFSLLASIFPSTRPKPRRL